MPYLDPADALNARSVPIEAGPMLPDEPWSRVPLIAGAGMRLVQLAMPRGDRTIPHYHPRAGEFFYVLWGSADFWIGDGPPQAAVSGDLLYAAPGVIHAIVAGEAGVRFLAGMGPNEDAPDEMIEVEIAGYPT
jgi:quercetin dioxygenase-like cupin family protein